MLMVSNDRRTDRPTPEEIETLLGHFRPMPGSEYYKKTAEMPWKKAEANSFRVVAIRRRQRPRAWFLGVVTTFIMVFGIVANPGLRAFAEEVRLLFDRADNDQILVDIIFPSTIGDLIGDEIDPLEIAETGALAHLLIDGSYASAVEIAENRVRFDIHTPSAVPSEFSLDSIFAVEAVPWVVLTYGSEENSESFAITQRHLVPGLSTTHDPNGIYRTSLWPDNDPELNRPQVSVVSHVAPDGRPIGDVGASAQLRGVVVGSVVGEYVSGAWVATDSSAVPYTLDSGVIWRVERVWDPDAPVHTLRWETDLYSYELTYFGNSMTLEELVAIAKSLN